MAFARVCWIGTMVTTSILQTVGFFSPEWACNIEKSNVTSSNDSCEIKGLLFPSVLDGEIFGLCLSSLSVSLICTGVMLVRFKKLFENDELEYILMQTNERVSSIIFIIFQFLAGVANVLCFVRYDVIGWSATLFFTFAFPVFVVVAGIVAVYCLYLCSQD